MASLNQATINRIPIDIPPIAEQQEVVSTLGTLDDKISGIDKVVHAAEVCHCSSSS